LVLQDLVGKGMQRRFGIPGIEFCDDHHTTLLLLVLALPPVLGPLLRTLLSGHLTLPPLASW
jgi:hypothetical protein